jgi:hypothetical protein
MCGKVDGSVTCRGCEKHFCNQHAVEHRQELGKQLDELTLDHNLFRENLIKQTPESQPYSLMKQIDEWEQQSIDKIRRTAHDARKRLQIAINEHTTKITKDLAKISGELHAAREDDDFFETDLEQWMKKLDELRNDLTQLPSIEIDQGNSGIISLITKVVEVTSPKETFGRAMGNIRIEDIGQVIVKQEDVDDASARGTGQYSSGQHRFRFKIEECDTSRWVFIGIISKDVPMEVMSYKSQSSYGWAGGDSVYLNGSKQPGFNGYKSDLEKDDILELLVNCDQQLLRLKNERTRSIYEIKVDANKCRFPWQLNVHLYWANNRVRILQM